MLSIEEFATCSAIEFDGFVVTASCGSTSVKAALANRPLTHLSRPLTHGTVRVTTDHFAILDGEATVFTARWTDCTDIKQRFADVAGSGRSGSTSGSLTSAAAIRLTFASMASGSPDIITVESGQAAAVSGALKALHLLAGSASGEQRLASLLMAERDTSPPAARTRGSPAASSGGASAGPGMLLSPQEQRAYGDSRKLEHQQQLLAKYNERSRSATSKQPQGAATPFAAAATRAIESLDRRAELEAAAVAAGEEAMRQVRVREAAMRQDIAMPPLRASSASRPGSRGPSVTGRFTGEREAAGATGPSRRERDAAAAAATGSLSREQPRAPPQPVDDATAARRRAAAAQRGGSSRSASESSAANTAFALSHAATTYGPYASQMQRSAAGAAAAAAAPPSGTSQRGPSTGSAAADVYAAHFGEKLAAAQRTLEETPALVQRVAQQVADDAMRREVAVFTANPTALMGPGDDAGATAGPFDHRAAPRSVEALHRDFAVADASAAVDQLAQNEQQALRALEAQQRRLEEMGLRRPPRPQQPPAPVSGAAAAMPAPAAAMRPPLAPPADPPTPLQRIAETCASSSEGLPTRTAGEGGPLPQSIELPTSSSPVAPSEPKPVVPATRTADGGCVELPAGEAAPHTVDTAISIRSQPGGSSSAVAHPSASTVQSASAAAAVLAPKPAVLAEEFHDAGRVLRDAGDWRETRDKTTGKVYFYHKATKKSTWKIEETPFAAMPLPRGPLVAAASNPSTQQNTTPAVEATSPPATIILSMTVPSTTVPSTTVPSTTVPSTTVPSTTIPSTTIPSTTIPSTTMPVDGGPPTRTEPDAAPAKKTPAPKPSPPPQEAPQAAAFRRAKEEAEKRAQEEALLRAREAAEEARRDAAHAKSREEAARKAREEAERKAKEDAMQRAAEEADRRAKEEAEKKTKEEALRRAEAVRQEAARLAAEEALRLKKAEEEAASKKKKEEEEAATKARPTKWRARARETDGKPFYVNVETKESVWSLPPGGVLVDAAAPTSPSPADSSKTVAAPTSPGDVVPSTAAGGTFRIKHREDGRPYYVNCATKLSAWTLPPGAVLLDGEALSPIGSSGSVQQDGAKVVGSAGEGDGSPKKQPLREIGDWREMRDERTGKLYYTNRVTKDRQWSAEGTPFDKK